MEDVPDFIETWEITVEHVKSGRAGFFTVTHDITLPPDAIMQEIKRGAGRAAYNILVNSWHRLPPEEPA